MGWREEMMQRLADKDAAYSDGYTAGFEGILGGGPGKSDVLAYEYGYANGCKARDVAEQTKRLLATDF